MPLLLQRVGVLIAFTDEVHCCGLQLNLQNDDFAVQKQTFYLQDCMFVSVLEACNLDCCLKRLRRCDCQEAQTFPFVCFSKACTSKQAYLTTMSADVSAQRAHA